MRSIKHVNGMPGIIIGIDMRIDGGRRAGTGVLFPARTLGEWLSKAKPRASSVHANHIVAIRRYAFPKAISIIETYTTV